MNGPAVKLEDLPLVVRENFKAIRDFLKENSNLQNFTLFELTFTQAVTAQKIPHRLGFAPKDVVQTSLLGVGTLTWNYDKFDETNIVVTTTGACVVRAYIGTETEGVSA